MKIIFKGSFDRDIDKIRNQELRKALDDKISQIVNNHLQSRWLVKK